MGPLLFIAAAVVLLGLTEWIGRRGGARRAPAPAPEPFGPPKPETLSWSKSDLETLITEISTEEGYGRPGLARAIAWVESSMNPDAINRADRPPSVGLMQLKLPTARAYLPHIAHENDLFDPPTNVRAGIRFLKDLEAKWLKTYGLDGVIQMYNLGETRFRAGERAPAYLARVRARL